MGKSVTSSFGTVAREGHDSSRFYKRNMYKSIESKKLTKIPPKENTSPLEVNKLYVQSSVQMHQIPDNSVHLMITSPPYNVGKDYDKDLSQQEYKQLLMQVFQETYRVLEEGGRACINIANIGRKPYIPLHALIVSIMSEIGFFMRGEIIWDKGASAGTSCAWGSWKSATNPVLRDTHEYILIYSKKNFARRSHQKSTITKDEFLEYTKSIWRFPAESAKRVSHPAPFPLELPKRLISLYSFEQDIVLDPFMGSGTTCLAAKELDRTYLGYDVDPVYIEIASQRLQSLW